MSRSKKIVALALPKNEEDNAAYKSHILNNCFIYTLYLEEFLDYNY